MKKKNLIRLTALSTALMLLFCDAGTTYAFEKKSPVNQHVFDDNIEQDISDENAESESDENKGGENENTEGDNKPEETGDKTENSESGNDETQTDNSSSDDSKTESEDAADKTDNETTESETTESETTESENTESENAESDNNEDAEQTEDNKSEDIKSDENNDKDSEKKEDEAASSTEYVLSESLKATMGDYVYGSDGVEYENVTYISKRAYMSLDKDTRADYISLCDEIPEMRSEDEAVRVVFSTTADGTLEMVYTLSLCEFGSVVGELEETEDYASSDDSENNVETKTKQL